MSGPIKQVEKRVREKLNRKLQGNYSYPDELIQIDFPQSQNLKDYLISKKIKKWRRSLRRKWILLLS